MSEKAYKTTLDSNQRLDVIEQEMKEFMNKDPDEYQSLTASMLLSGVDQTPTQLATDVATQMDALMPRELRARAVGAGMFKVLQVDGVLLFEMYELGAYSHGQGWVRKMKETMNPNSLAAGLTDAELGLSWEVFRYNVQLLAERGAKMRRRKDSTI